MLRPVARPRGDPQPIPVMNPTFFENPADFRAWLADHHAAADSLWVGVHEKGSGRRSITWPGSVDEAPCYAWLDGIRRGVDATSDRIRFTPRQAGSVWTSTNVNRVQARRESRSGLYSHERGEVELPEPYRGFFHATAAARESFQGQPASYRKAASWWVASGKKDETRRKRLGSLVAHPARGERLPQFARRQPSG